MQALKMSGGVRVSVYEFVSDFRGVEDGRYHVLQSNAHHQYERYVIGSSNLTAIKMHQLDSL